MRVNIFIPPQLLREADQEAEQSNLSRSGLIQRALREYIDRSCEAREQAERERVRYEASERIDRLAERLGDWDPIKAVREGRERRRRTTK
ncbi:MAG: type II toxin-antitoxin system HicB family antitoxin [Chloroflexi bacterium]|nr:type II toxin-antitoxin system HicB family antitoxin [Chloroflexota bacterium]